MTNRPMVTYLRPGDKEITVADGPGTQQYAREHGWILKIDSKPAKKAKAKPKPE